MAKIKQSETVTIKRSQIKFAAYNPRKKDPKIVDKLKANFKKVGFMGGVVWNAITGNLVGGHKRVEAMDLIFNYNGEKDYDIKVEKVELDQKTEMEQNIFLNNRRAQGENDLALMAEIIPTIDIEAAALEEIDIELIESVVPNFTLGNKDDIQKDMSKLDLTAEEKQAKKDYVLGLKKDIRSGVAGGHQATHFTVAFKDYDSKAEFLESIGINGDDTMITSEKFLKRFKDMIE